MIHELRESDVPQHVRQMVRDYCRNGLTAGQVVVAVVNAMLPLVTCDCGAPRSTQCHDCVVSEYQANHPDCDTCCPPLGAVAGHAQEGPGSSSDERKALLQLVDAMPSLAPNATGLSHAMGLIIRAAFRPAQTYQEGPGSSLVASQGPDRGAGPQEDARTGAAAPGGTVG